MRIPIKRKCRFAIPIKPSSRNTILKSQLLPESWKAEAHMANPLFFCCVKNCTLVTSLNKCFNIHSK